ncbi:hypothetical protein DOTSEDRAFT_135895 [Dothistroma septosporum NZE10]|uniref:Carboxylesterase type B domain-containing protein n=1 Tax=Dothistroma septosporum (strain NZE10 / CBS 128990) TaxID=675120 RepID=N1PIU6_DOTSN|nr:hypothetical protein DOTSEDRAFT_135895 [Dothistroma septosporum NZE10]
MTIKDTAQKPYVLRTARGSLIGTEVADAETNRPLFRRYTRIRYAVPPVREGRWRKPEPLPPDWLFSDGNNRPRDYRGIGSICPQIVPKVDLGSYFGPPATENDMDEDCLFINVWVPAGGEGPVDGWPVQFQIIADDFQNSPGLNHRFVDPIDIFREHHKDNPRIIVFAQYRCGIFGFLASEELVRGDDVIKSDPFAAPGNFGLWDIRMAVQWTYSNIHLFGGNPECISVGGFGAATAFQLHYDAFEPFSKPVIRRAFLFSGAVGMQPVFVQSSKPRAQFAEICRRVNIDDDLPSEDRVKLLRGVSSHKLLAVVRMMQTTFDPVTDGPGGFIPAQLMASIWNGELGRRLKTRNVQVLIGDTSNVDACYSFMDERTGLMSPVAPAMASRKSLVSRLSITFPENLAEALVVRYESPYNNDWPWLYSKIMADVQCHAIVRGFAQSLFHGGMTSQDVLRYHIAWRFKGTGSHINPMSGTSNTLDMPIWWYGGWSAGFSRRERQDVTNFARPFARFLRGDISAMCGWGTEAQTDVRMLAADGSVLITEDPLKGRMRDLWELMKDAQVRRESGGMRSRYNGTPGFW